MKKPPILSFHCSLLVQHLEPTYQELLHQKPNWIQIWISQPMDFISISRVCYSKVLWLYDAPFQFTSRSQNHRTTKVGKDHYNHLVQQLTDHPLCPLNHRPQCHFYPFLKKERKRSLSATVIFMHKTQALWVWKWETEWESQFCVRCVFSQT